MNSDAILDLLLHGNQLKRMPRTGWLQRGVPEAENVAAHSYGVGFAALTLALVIDATMDLGRVLAMAILHDLPEGTTGDIPSPAWPYLPAGTKEGVERRILEEMLSGSELSTDFSALWDELQAAATDEARLVHDADKLDLYLQALVYEQETGNRRLAEFWAKPVQFHFPQVQALYEALRRRRERS